MAVVFLAIASCGGGGRRTACPDAGPDQASDGACSVASDAVVKRDAPKDYTTECPSAVSMAVEDRACTLAPGSLCRTVCRQCDSTVWILDRESQSPCTCTASGTWDCALIPVDCLPAQLGCTTGSFADRQCQIPRVCPNPG